MAKKITTNICLDAELKKEAKELFEKLGMDMTSAVTIFLKQCLIEKGFPFKPSLNTEIEKNEVNENGK